MSEKNESRKNAPIIHDDYVDRNRIPGKILPPSVPATGSPTRLSKQFEYSGLDRVFGGGREFDPGEFTDSFDILYDEHGSPVRAMIPACDAAEEREREDTAIGYYEEHSPAVIGDLPAVSDATNELGQLLIPHERTGDHGRERELEPRQQERGCGGPLDSKQVFIDPL